MSEELPDLVRGEMRVARERLDEQTRNSAPAVAHAIAPAISRAARRSNSVLNMLTVAAITPIVRSELKRAGINPDRSSQQQMEMWPADLRALLESVGRAAVFVPSEGRYIDLTPDAITADMVSEAAAYLKGKAAETERRSTNLEALARIMRVHPRWTSPPDAPSPAPVPPEGPRPLP